MSKCEKCGAEVRALTFGMDLPIGCSDCLDDYYKTRTGEDEGFRDWVERTREEAEDRWIDAHSVNCIKCGVLFDEREGVSQEEGTLCAKCAK